MRIMSHLWIALAALVMVVIAVRCGSAKGPAFTNPEEAGVDYQIQGEYLGRVKTEERDQVWGVQVIALGDGKFDLVGFAGGLPGDGWNRGGETMTYSGELKDKKAVFQTDEGTVQVADGKLHFIDENSTTVINRVERKSPTLGIQPPPEAIVLFDGTSLAHWDDGQIVDGQWLGATNATTKKKWGDHSLHVEFRTPFMPQARGQQRGNSGVYIQGQYELQVLDSFGLEGKNNECGGIYTVAEPIVNGCLPPLAWQTYDIDFVAARYEGDKKVQNARVTVKHNGVLIHDNLELPKGTPGFRPEGPGNESLFLQNHGDPVVFRNLWIVPK